MLFRDILGGNLTGKDPSCAQIGSQAKTPGSQQALQHAHSISSCEQLFTVKYSKPIPQKALTLPVRSLSERSSNSAMRDMCTGGEDQYWQNCTGTKMIATYLEVGDLPNWLEWCQ
jgi:hypothetical protein